MIELKTRPTDVNVEEFLEDVDHPTRKADGFKLLEIMKEVTLEEPVMWGSSIIGFGTFHYKYASGREVDWMKVGFSPRKRSLTVYLTPGLDDIEDLREVLGKHRVGKGARAQVVEGHPYHELSRRKDFIDTGSRPSILFDYLSYHKKNEVSFLKNTVPSQVYFNYADTL